MLRGRADRASAQAASEREVAAAKKAAARAHGDFMRMRAERDELEWLLQRGDARAAGTIAKSAAVQMDTEC